MVALYVIEFLLVALETMAPDTVQLQQVIAQRRMHSNDKSVSADTVPGARTSRIGIGDSVQKHRFCLGRTERC
jgi:hypothetical protein